MPSFILRGIMHIPGHWISTYNPINDTVLMTSLRHNALVRAVDDAGNNIHGHFKQGQNIMVSRLESGDFLVQFAEEALMDAAQLAELL